MNNNIEDLYVASEAFVARTPFEISFDVGTEILVVNSDREDYWKVEMKGVYGYAPSSFLEPSSLENYDLVRFFLFFFCFGFAISLFSFLLLKYCPL